MDSQQAAGLALGVVVNVAILWVAFNVRQIWREARWPCACKHDKASHVSAMDWDSDYGDPEHKWASYRKPGTCRKCVCRHYNPERKAA